MNVIVVYKSKYGSTRDYAQWIADELKCVCKEAGETHIDELEKYDTIIYGGGLYAGVIGGVSLITKNYERLKGKKIIVFTTGLAPLENSNYYNSIREKNFKGENFNQITVFNFLGKMIQSELTLPHRGALKLLKRMLKNKKELSPDEELLMSLCDADSDFRDKASIKPLIKAVCGS